MGKTYCGFGIMIGFCLFSAFFALQAGDRPERDSRRVLILCPDCYPAVKARVAQRDKTIWQLERDRERLIAEKQRLQGQFTDGLMLGLIVGVCAALYFTGDPGCLDA